MIAVSLSLFLSNNDDFFFLNYYLIHLLIFSTRYDICCDSLF